MPIACERSESGQAKVWRAMGPEARRTQVGPGNDMALWISLPLTDTERVWLERLGVSWRYSNDLLWRKSGVEAALVTPEIWRHWQLPEPPAPIISVAVTDLAVIEEMVAAGCSWASPVSLRPWGVRAGFLKLPSGVLLEVGVFDHLPGQEPSEEAEA